MAQQAEQYDIRRELLKIILDKVQSDRFPSTTHMDIVEELMSPDEKSIYAQVLVDKISRQANPSLDMIRRVMQLG